jgi:hypothetical protein
LDELPNEIETPKPIFTHPEQIDEYYGITRGENGEIIEISETGSERLGSEFGGVDGVFDIENANDMAKFDAYQGSYERTFAEQTEVAGQVGEPVEVSYEELVTSTTDARTAMNQVLAEGGTGVEAAEAYQEALANSPAPVKVGDTITNEAGETETVLAVDNRGITTTGTSFGNNPDGTPRTFDQWQAMEAEFNAQSAASETGNPLDAVPVEGYRDGSNNGFERAADSFAKANGFDTKNIMEVRGEPGTFIFKSANGDFEEFQFTKNGDGSFNASPQGIHLEDTFTPVYDHTARFHSGQLDNAVVGLDMQDDTIEIVGRMGSDRNTGEYLVKNADGTHSIMKAELEHTTDSTGATVQRARWTSSSPVQTRGDAEAPEPEPQR